MGAMCAGGEIGDLVGRHGLGRLGVVFLLSFLPLGLPWNTSPPVSSPPSRRLSPRPIALQRVEGVVSVAWRNGHRRAGRQRRLHLAGGAPGPGRRGRVPEGSCSDTAGSGDLWCGRGRGVRGRSLPLVPRVWGCSDLTQWMMRRSNARRGVMVTVVPVGSDACIWPVVRPDRGGEEECLKAAAPIPPGLATCGAAGGGVSGGGPSHWCRGCGVARTSHSG